MNFLHQFLPDDDEWRKFKNGKYFFKILKLNDKFYGI